MSGVGQWTENKVAALQSTCCLPRPQHFRAPAVYRDLSTSECLLSAETSALQSACCLPRLQHCRAPAVCRDFSTAERQLSAETSALQSACCLPRPQHCRAPAVCRDLSISERLLSAETSALQSACCLPRPQHCRVPAVYRDLSAGSLDRREAARRPAATRRARSLAGHGLCRGMSLGAPWDSDPVRLWAPCSVSGSGSALTIHAALKGMVTCPLAATSVCWMPPCDGVDFPCDDCGTRILCKDSDLHGTFGVAQECIR